MIVRVLGEGQYELEQSELDGLQSLDAQAQQAIEAGDEAAFQSSYGELLERLRATATRVADDDLRPSDLILPPADATIDEARGNFSDDGLIPG